MFSLIVMITEVMSNTQVKHGSLKVCTHELNPTSEQSLDSTSYQRNHGPYAHWISALNSASVTKVKWKSCLEQGLCDFTSNLFKYVNFCSITAAYHGIGGSYYQSDIVVVKRTCTSALWCSSISTMTWKTIDFIK